MVENTPDPVGTHKKNIEHIHGCLLMNKCRNLTYSALKASQICCLYQQNVQIC